MNAQHLDRLDSPSHVSVSNDDLEIDVRKFIEILLAWWREIALVTIGITFLTVALFMSYEAYEEPVYETSSDVILARVVSNVNLVDSFTTTTEGIGQATNAINARREALVRLVQSGAIAKAVADELGDMLNQNERKPAVLLKMVNAKAPIGQDDRTISDLIRITVQADSPEKAEAIANSWTKHYIQHINSVYNQVPVEIFDSVQNELQQATADYEAAQQALETFIASSRIDEIQNEINQKTALRTNYLDAQTALLTNLIDQDRATRLKLFNDLVSTQTNAVYQVFNSQVQEQVDNLTQLYYARDLTQRQLAQAQNLGQQIDAGADAQAPGTLLALQLLKTQVYATIEGSSLPGGLNINIDTSLTDKNANPQADITTLIDTLQNYVSQLDDQIATLSDQLLAGEGYSYIDRYTPENLTISTATTAQAITATQTITNAADEQSQLASAIYERYFDLFRVSDLAQLGQTELSAGSSTEMSVIISDLNSELQNLQATLAAEQSKQLLITQQRDLMWTAYNTLNNKLVEFKLARTAANSEVRLGSPAIAPLNPLRGTSLRLVAVAAGASGLIIGIIAIAISHLLGKRPWLSKNPIA